VHSNELLFSKGNCLLGETRYGTPLTSFSNPNDPKTKEIIITVVDRKKKKKKNKYKKKIITEVVKKKKKKKIYISHQLIYDSSPPN